MAEAPRERNIQTFNADTAALGGYVYTAIDRWSSKCATGRQTEELAQLLKAHFPPTVRIADVGCGDGTFTVDLAEKFRPASIRGVDPASNAIAAGRARIPPHLAGSVSFEVGDIYNVENKGEDLAIGRGVLHHVDRLEDAIARMAQQFKTVIILDPNGFNPVLKVIEKVSPYHRKHDEKSWAPSRITRAFKSHGFTVVSMKYFVLVPYFCPTPLAKFLSKCEPIVEAVPGVREISCGSILALYQRGY